VAQTISPILFGIMEAFAVAASVLQVATVGLALAQALYGLCDEASSGKEQVKDLAF
jgi:hypothetical protein